MIIMQIKSNMDDTLGCISVSVFYVFLLVKLCFICNKLPHLKKFLNYNKS